MLERAGGDAATFDELLDIAAAQPDDAPEPEGGQLPLVDEPVERAGAQPEHLSGLAAAHPLDRCAGR